VHSSAVTALDWSRDSKYLRAVDQAYAKIFYNVEESIQVPDGMTTLIDTSIWATSTCKLGWEVAGVFPQGADGTDINAVDASADRKTLVAADDFGSICVYKFPVLKNSQPCRRITGHSEHVTRARFLNNEKETENYIISAGGNDRTYIQWKEVALKE
jgi:WD40 repeat protein